MRFTCHHFFYDGSDWATTRILPRTDHNPHFRGKPIINIEYIYPRSGFFPQTLDLDPTVAYILLEDRKSLIRVIRDTCYSNFLHLRTISRLQVFLCDRLSKLLLESSSFPDLWTLKSLHVWDSFVVAASSNRGHLDCEQQRNKERASARVYG